MKKFEIINDTWIKQLDFPNAKYRISGFTAIRIDTISYWDNWVSDIGSGIEHSIRFFNDSKLQIDLIYDKNEANQYNEDLVFFENLLFGKSK